MKPVEAQEERDVRAGDFMTHDYEYKEWRFSQYGVFWRCEGAVQEKFEQLERDGWVVFLTTIDDRIVLCRKIPKPPMP